MGRSASEMAARLFCLATDGAFVALLIIMSASAMYDMDESQVVALLAEDAVPAPPVQYDQIPGLRYEPKSALEFDEKSLSECQALCTNRGKGCSAFSYESKKQECKISPDHLGYDPDFVMEQKTSQGRWEYFAGMTGYARGYLRVEMKTEPQCKAMCVKAPACALFSYRKIDGLCLVSGRALAMEENWTYYEKQGVARNSNGFPLPPKIAHAKKMKQVHAASAAFLARQLAALEKSQKERKLALQAAEDKQQAEREKLSEADAKVQILDGAIATVKSAELGKVRDSEREQRVHLEEQKIQMKKQNDVKMDALKIKSMGGHNEINAAKQAAADDLKLAKGKADGMLKSAKQAAKTATYVTDAKEAVKAAKRSEEEAVKEGVLEAEIKEHASKKAAMDAENLNARVMMDIKTRRKMQLQTSARIARIEQAADHASADVGSDITRSVSSKLRLDILQAKGHLEAQQKEFEANSKLSADKDAAHLERIKFWRKKLADMTEETDQMSATLLRQKTAKDTALARVKMDVDLGREEVPRLTKTAKLEAVTKIEVRKMKKSITDANIEETERFVERQRAAELVANHAAHERKAQELGKEESAPFMTKVEKAKLELEQLGKAVSKMPKKDGQRILNDAQEKYDNLVKDENGALEAISRNMLENPPIIESRKIAADSIKSVGFDIKAAKPIDLEEVKEDKTNSTNVDAPTY